MNLKNISKYLLGVALFTAPAACTDLSETVYDQIVSINYYNTRNDVIRAYVRPFEHAFWSITPMYSLQEGTADQQGTYNREGWWLDGGKYQRLHYHTWTLDDGDLKGGWTGNYQGIMQVNAVLDDFKTLNPDHFGMTRAELDEMNSGLRTMRAWFYINLLDLFRNVPLAVSADPTLNSVGQVPPGEVFDFIESELKAVIPMLPIKAAAGGNGVMQGQWTQAGAAALLVKLYLNAEKWTGTPRYDDCMNYAQAIIDGEYGHYRVADRWDEAFDWNNETSDEVIFAFTAGKSRANWHMGEDMYWWSLPSNLENYFGYKDRGGGNPKYALQPGRDIDGNPYTFELGKPVLRFQEYPQDYRLKKYRNLGAEATREGMFLHGYLDYIEGGEVVHVKSPNGYEYYLRDQVGMFKDAAPGTIIADKESNMNHADHNSGWHPVKYPVYRDGDKGEMEADYALIRLPEVIYSLAECKLRTGKPDEAARLLNTVRRRNYPEAYHDLYLYAPEGKALLTEAEMLHEWGREFLAEGRRRTDLCRWGKFSTGTWWDKQPDADSHTDIFLLHRDILSTDLNLRQNPGYEDINR